MIETIVPAMIGAAGSILQNKIQNEQSKQNIEHAAAVNYGYGEMSADNAQARTKALYSEPGTGEGNMQGVGIKAKGAGKTGRI